MCVHVNRSRLAPQSAMHFDGVEWAHIQNTSFITLQKGEHKHEQVAIVPSE